MAGALIVMFGYPVAMETLTRGRTVGSYALGCGRSATTAGRSGSVRRSSAG